MPILLVSLPAYCAVVIILTVQILALSNWWVTSRNSSDSTLTMVKIDDHQWTEIDKKTYQSYRVTTHVTPDENLARRNPVKQIVCPNGVYGFLDTVILKWTSEDVRLGVSYFDRDKKKFSEFNLSTIEYATWASRVIHILPVMEEVTVTEDGGKQVLMQSLKGIQMFFVSYFPQGTDDWGKTRLTSGFIKMTSANKSADGYYNFRPLLGYDLNYTPLAGISLCDIDFEGRSIVAGKPTMSYFNKTVELFGLYSCLPFEQGISTNLPNVNISTSSNTINGLSISTMSSWQAGVNTSGSLGPKWLTVSAHFGKSYGGSTMDMDDNQHNKSVHLTSGISEADLIHGYTADFYVWEFPIYKKN